MTLTFDLQNSLTGYTWYVQLSRKILGFADPSSLQLRAGVIQTDGRKDRQTERQTGYNIYCHLVDGWQHSKDVHELFVVPWQQATIDLYCSIMQHVTKHQHGSSHLWDTPITAQRTSAHMPRASLSVCSSVCLSHSCVTPKRFNFKISKYALHCTIEECL